MKRDKIEQGLMETGLSAIIHAKKLIMKKNKSKTDEAILYTLLLLIPLDFLEEIKKRYQK